MTPCTWCDEKPAAYSATFVCENPEAHDDGIHVTYLCQNDMPYYKTAFPQIADKWVRL
jgi:hypothetical protein